MTILQLGATLFGQLSLTACAEWLWSGYAVRIPEPQDRDVRGRHRLGGDAARPARQHRRPLAATASGWDVRPADVLRRNFWFCTIDDPSTIDTRHTIGVENIMVEVDYPHGDDLARHPTGHQRRVGPHPRDELRLMCSENAAHLFRHPLPDVVLPR